jgi:hypothetical protein
MTYYRFRGTDGRAESRRPGHQHKIWLKSKSERWWMAAKDLEEEFPPDAWRPPEEAQKAGMAAATTGKWICDGYH